MYRLDWDSVLYQYAIRYVIRWRSVVALFVSSQTWLNCNLTKSINRSRFPCLRKGFFNYFFQVIGRRQLHNNFSLTSAPPRAFSIIASTFPSVNIWDRASEPKSQIFSDYVLRFQIVRVSVNPEAINHAMFCPTLRTLELLPPENDVFLQYFLDSAEILTGFSIANTKRPSWNLRIH